MEFNSIRPNVERLFAQLCLSSDQTVKQPGGGKMSRNSCWPGDWVSWTVLRTLWSHCTCWVKAFTRIFPLRLGIIHALLFHNNIIGLRHLSKILYWRMMHCSVLTYNFNYRESFPASELSHWCERRQCLYICLTSLQIVDYETGLLSNNLISGIRRALSSIKRWVTINVRWVLNYGLQLSNTHPKGSA